MLSASASVTGFQFPGFENPPINLLITLGNLKKQLSN